VDANGQPAVLRSPDEEYEGIHSYRVAHGDFFQFLCLVLRAILARAHARVADVARIAGYCGKSKVMDEALALWAESYGNQTILDHADLVKAVKDNQNVQAMVGK
jgi:hypothetical protein